jgi:hypothetical protein
LATTGLLLLHRRCTVHPVHKKTAFVGGFFMLAVLLNNFIAAAD